MDFRRLIEAECGQSNPVSQLVQHVTENKTLQDNYGNPSAPGFQQYNSMQPQSFRMADLVQDINQIETHDAMSARPYIPAQNRWLADGTQVPQYQENSQARFWKNPNVQNCENITNHFYSASFANVFPPPSNELPMLAPVIPISAEHDKTSEDFGKRVIVESLNELEEESEETFVNPQELESKLLTKPKKRKIPEFDKYKDFEDFICDYIDEHCVNGQVCKNLRVKKINKLEITKKGILNSKKYSHIKNNPMVNIPNVVANGKQAITNHSYDKAVLYFDEAVRRDPTCSSNWSDLSFCLYKSDKMEEATSSLKQLLSLDPGHTDGHRLISLIYNQFDCDYQVCYWIFNWLKNNESYNHLIPRGFTMGDKNTTKLKNGLLDTVKRISIKAARLNPTNPDCNLQLMMASLYKLSDDYEKAIDCMYAGIKAVDITKSYNEIFKFGFLLLREERPFEALDIFFSILDEKHNRRKFATIGLVHMYTKNYTEAIRYLKKGLNIEDSEEPKFQIEEYTLEAQFELSLRLIVEYCNTPMRRV